MDKINIKRVLICFNDKKERTNTKIMQSQGENPHDHDTAESKIIYVCTFQGYIYLNISMSVFVSIFVANEFWADYDFLVYKISLKK